MSFPTIQTALLGGFVGTGTGPTGEKENRGLEQLENNMAEVYVALTVFGSLFVPLQKIFNKCIRIQSKQAAEPTVCVSLVFGHGLQASTRMCQAGDVGQARKILKKK